MDTRIGQAFVDFGFAVLPGPPIMAAAFVAIVQHLTVTVVSARVGRAMVNRNLAVSSLVALGAVTDVGSCLVFAPAVNTRVRLTFIDVFIAVNSCPPFKTGTSIAVHQIFTFAVQAWVG
jgi:hypothetical protein